jgi:hypothetical protein
MAFSLNAGKLHAVSKSGAGMRGTQKAKHRKGAVLFDKPQWESQEYCCIITTLFLANKGVIETNLVLLVLTIKKLIRA